MWRRHRLALNTARLQRWRHAGAMVAEVTTQKSINWSRSIQHQPLNHLETDENCDFPLFQDHPKKPWKYVLFTCFCTGKYAPCTGKYAPGTGYTLGYVQNTYFLRTLDVLFTYFGVRLNNHIFTHDSPNAGRTDLHNCFGSRGNHHKRSMGNLANKTQTQQYYIKGVRCVCRSIFNRLWSM